MKEIIDEGVCPKDSLVEISDGDGRSITIPSLINNTIDEINTIVGATVHLSSEIKSHYLYHDIHEYFNEAKNCYSHELAGADAKALIYFTSASELIINLSYLFQNESLNELGIRLRMIIQHALLVEKALCDATLQVSVAKSLSSAQLKMREITTAAEFHTASMSASPLVDRIIVPYARFSYTRKNIEKINSKLSVKNLPKNYNPKVSRFRLNTEHGQSINVFRAEMCKRGAVENTDLVIISIHGNGFCAAGDFSFRISELNTFLMNSNAERVVLLSPDLPGSVASGGHGESLGEISKNSIQKLVHHLLQQGINPAQIVVHGHSLGGLIAVHAVHALKQQGVDVSLISVDSLAQVQKFLPEVLVSVLAPITVKHFDAPAYKLFDELDENRRFCIHKIADSIIRPGNSLLFNLPGNECKSGDNINPDDWASRVNREDCVLLQEKIFDHNVGANINMDHQHDLTWLDSGNPCLRALEKFHTNAFNFRRVSYDAFVKKIQDGIKKLKAVAAEDSRLNSVDNESFSMFFQLTEKLAQSDMCFENKAQIILEWVMKCHDNVVMPRGFFAGMKGSIFSRHSLLFKDYIHLLFNDLQSNCYLNNFMATSIRRLHCQSLLDEFNNKNIYAGNSHLSFGGKYDYKSEFDNAVAKSHEEMLCHNTNFNLASSRWFSNQKERLRKVTDNIVRYQALWQPVEGGREGDDVKWCVERIVLFLRHKDTILEAKSHAFSLMRVLSPLIDFDLDMKMEILSKQPEKLRDLFCEDLYSYYCRGVCVNTAATIFY